MAFSRRWYKSLIHKRDADVGPRVNPYAPFKSSWEAQWASILDAERRAGKWASVAYEVASFCIVPATARQKGVHYRPDFVCLDPHGRLTIFEVKGRWIGGAKAKVKALVALLPTARVYIVRKVKGENWDCVLF